MSSIQINQVQMPQLKEIGLKNKLDTDKDFTFTLLSKIGEGELQEKLTKMIEGITEQGNKISEHMDIREVRAYREMISEFIGEVIANSHKFSRENFLDRRGRHRVYGIVRLVNEKVDQLARELMKSETNQLELLEKVGEIQGLLLDIVT